MAERMGIEPTRAEARRISNPLPYRLGDLSAIDWQRAEESNPHPFGATVFGTVGRPSARALWELVDCYGLRLRGRCRDGT